MLRKDECYQINLTQKSDHHNSYHREMKTRFHNQGYLSLLRFISKYKTEPSSYQKQKLQ